MKYPLNYPIQCATRTGVVTLPQCHLFIVDLGIMHTPYKSLLEKLIMRVDKSQKYNLLSLTKSPKLGIILCVEAY